MFGDSFVSGEDTFVFGNDKFFRCGNTSVLGEDTFVFGDDTFVTGEDTYVPGENTYAHLGVGYRPGMASANAIGLALGRSEAPKIYTPGGGRGCDGHLLNNIK